MSKACKKDKKLNISVAILKLGSNFWPQLYVKSKHKYFMASDLQTTKVIGVVQTYNNLKLSVLKHSMIAVPRITKVISPLRKEII